MGAMCGLRVKKWKGRRVESEKVERWKGEKEAAPGMKGNTGFKGCEKAQSSLAKAPQERNNNSPGGSAAEPWE